MKLVERTAVAEAKDKVVMVVVLLVVRVFAGADMGMTLGAMPAMSIVVDVDVRRVEGVVSVTWIVPVF